MRRLPNFITFLRLLSSPVLVWLLIQSRFRAALALVLFAGLTDWFDGFAARRFGASGKLGAILDPLADKSLLVVLFLTLGVLRFIPLWLVTLTVLRDLVIVAGAGLLRLFRDIRTFAPSLLGKVSTFFQIVFILLVLLQAAFPNQVVRLGKDAALICTAVFTFLSGLGYVRLGIRLARDTAVVRM
ncbi:MAG TPA: CDP-alcohol phosphatidyltransferase family protein [Bryobacteraceae bacterium]